VKRILELLLSGAIEPRPIASLQAWWQRHREVEQRFELPADVALAGGFLADRLGYAFASGYQTAGSQLFGARAERLTAFCVTEEGGAHPRAIASTLAREGGGLRLDGRKLFVTLGPAAEDLVVVASVGRSGDRNQLRVARIDAGRTGITLTPVEGVSFVPEIPHALVTFSAVRVDESELLPGDGYLEYVKPFRTVEDCHVHAALLGWLAQIARRARADRDLLEAITANAMAIRALASADPSSRVVHIALAGAMEASRALLERIEPLCFSPSAPSRLDDVTRERWERDRALLKVAGKARALRRDAAWHQLGGAVAR
jgi:alkylation response protein AidB-like acyl-CoA dehydrogenase